MNTILKFLISFMFFFCINMYATNIKDLKEPGEIKLSSGNIITFEKLCIDGYVYLYFKQSNNDGLTQIMTTNMKGEKIPMPCFMGYN